jgi:hypothetical protein
MLIGISYMVASPDLSHSARALIYVLVLIAGGGFALFSE